MKRPIWTAEISTWLRREKNTRNRIPLIKTLYRGIVHLCSQPRHMGSLSGSHSGVRGQDEDKRCWWRILKRLPTCQPFRILRNLSAFEPCILHSAFISKYYRITDFTILQNKSRFKWMLNISFRASISVERWFVSTVVYHCLSGTERKRLRQETNRWIEQGEGEGLWKLFRENTKTFLSPQSTKCWQIYIWIKIAWQYKVTQLQISAWCQELLASLLLAQIPSSSQSV